MFGSDTEVLQIIKEEKKGRDLGRLARILVPRLPPNYTLDKLLFLQGNQWYDEPTIENYKTFPFVSDQEVKRISESGRHILIDQKDKMDDGKEIYALHRKVNPYL